jgi:diguanylate cyclase (GGDEF)-like protein
MSRRPNLRTMLTVPYVVLVLLVASLIAGLSYRAGRNAVDNLSGQLLVETVNRIAQAVDRHVAGSAAVLETAFPTGVAAPASITDSMGDLRTRFWLATSVHRDPNNYAYYGDRMGRFFGLWRFSASEAELRLRTTGTGPREVHRFTGIHGTLSEPTVETRIFDPRERPWFQAAQTNTASTWTSIYIDFKTTELVATRAKRVNGPTGEFEGVVATDLSLQMVTAFLKRLPVSTNGVAMVLEAGGELVGVSRGAHLQQVQGANARLKAQDSADPLVAAAYGAVQGWLQASDPTAARTGVFAGPQGQAVQAGYARIRDSSGLDWLVVVAVPRSDFLNEIKANARNTALLSALAAAGVVLIGLLVLGTVTRELRTLAAAVQRITNGDLSKPLHSEHRDELGALTRSFGQMQARLLTDSLTGLSNREAVIRRMEERIMQQRRRVDASPFAVLFADLNNFKLINDTHGHAVGDDALREVAGRLREAVRSQDMVARFAGDEFVIMVEQVQNRRDAETVRDHIENALGQPLRTLVDKPGAGEPAAGAACGLALFPDDGQDVQTLLKLADADMYARKSAVR